jgi:hypothetical protein
MRQISIALLIFACCCLQAQKMKTYLVAQRRAGVIEFMDPATLATVGQIHFDVGQDTVGLNGVSASSDGTRLYVNAPMPESPRGCCTVYSIDLGTLQAKRVGDWGSQAWAAYFNLNGIAYKEGEIFPRGGPEGGGVEVLDPTSHYLAQVRSFNGSLRGLDIYDLAQGTVAHASGSTGLNSDWFTSGVWSGDRFFLYGSRFDGTASRLWTVSPAVPQIGPGVDVKTFGQVPGCPVEKTAQLEKITAAGGNLFVFEEFGGKADRRQRCGSGVPGGAWVVDPDTGQLLHHDAPELQFTQLIADRTEPVFYGLSAEGSSSAKATVTLVRMDARNGSILESRNLDADWWWIAVAPLQKAPTGEVQVVP